MMPGKRSKGNYDPSRALGLPVGSDAAYTHVADRDDQDAPRGSAGAGDWRIAAGRAGLAGDRPSCNSAARDHSAGKERTSRRSPFLGKPVAGGPPRHEPPCLFAGGPRQRRQFRGNLKPAWIGAPKEGSPYRNPVASDDGVPFCFPPSSQTTPFGRMLMIWTDDLRLRRR